MKRMLKLACLLVGALASSVVFAEQPEYWQLPLHEAQRTDAYEQMCKRLRYGQLDDTEADLIFQTLLGRFFEQDSLVSLDLLLHSGPMLRRVRADPQLRARIAVHLMRVGETLPAGAWLGETYRYFDDLYPRRRVFLFLDALGSPIPGAEVQVFQGKDRTTKELRVQLTLDKNGLLFVPNKQVGMPSGISFTISHPDYGDAVIKRQQGGWPLIYVPLVSINNDAMSQSAWGVVADSQNNPIAGVQIWPCSLRTPGRGRIYPAHDSSSGNWPGCVVTDSNGRFALHFPVAGWGLSISKVPTHSRYDVSIRAPRELLVPAESQEIPCGQETLITLERSQLYFRTFVFEDANGPITEPNVLGKLFLGISPPGKNQLKFGYEDLKDGGKFPVGRYLAWIRNFGPGGALEFAPMDVNENSPTQLVFKPKDLEKQVTYSGRAVYGFTDRPASRVFVVSAEDTGEPDLEGPPYNSAMLTHEQWQRLHALGSYPELNEPALEPLRHMWRVHEVVRADERGRFSLSIPKHKVGRYQFHIIEQGYLHIYHGTVYFKDQDREPIELPTSRLFRAAKVVFELSTKCQYRADTELRDWIDADNNASWACDFMWYRSMLGVDIRYPIWCMSENIRAVQIPAGLEIRLRLRHRCPVYTDLVKAEPGEEVDLGFIEFEPKMPIYAQVLDPAGKPIEGLSVTHMEADRDLWWGESEITDTKGFAAFRVPYHYRGRFAVTCGGNFRDSFKESISYQTNGPADANNVYTLQLSDEMLRRLFGTD